MDSAKVFAILKFSRSINGSDKVDVNSQKFSIGRSKESSIVINEKYISAHHCCLDFGLGPPDHISLTDSSSNGTFVENNSTVVMVKHKTARVGFGDVIHLIMTDKIDKNLFFTVERAEISDTSNQTALYYPYFETSNITAVTKNVILQEASLTEVETQIADGGQNNNNVVIGRENSIEEPPGKKPRLARVADLQSQNRSTNEQEKNQPMPSVKPKPKASKEKDVLKKASLEFVPNQKINESINVSNENTDAIGATLTCSICCEIFFECVALQPCGHCFCEHCYVGWSFKQKRCPECRKKVKKFAKNHRIMSLVDIYLKEHSDKCRDEEEIKMIKQKQTEHRHNSDSGNSQDDGDSRLRRQLTGESFSSEDSYFDSGSSESDDVPDVVYVPPPVQPFVRYAQHPANFNYMPGFQNLVPQPAVPGCIQCPTYNFAAPIIGTIRPGTKMSPVFICAPNQNHILCACCLNGMPDRRQDRTCPQPMECFICKRTYCHLYLGCNKTGCNGCLNKFKEMNFGPGLPFIMDNYFESKILQNYLTSKNLQLSDLLKECLAKLDSGEYSSRDKFTFGLSSETVVCFNCALSNFQDLAYQYRKNIPANELPTAAVANRPDCWYGRSCRTQKNNPAHAAKLNHICEQTRR